MRLLNSPRMIPSPIPPSSMRMSTSRRQVTRRCAGARMNRVVHFEIHADDPGRARSFYEELFGWRFDRFGPMDYWLIYTGPPEQRGINGGLHKRVNADEGAADSGYVCTFHVKNHGATGKQLETPGSRCMAS